MFSTPHTHHNEKQIHQHEDGAHHHTNHAEEEEEEKTPSPFHYLQHTGGSAIEFIPAHPIQIKIKAVAIAQAVVYFSNVVLNQVDKPPLLLPASRKQNIPLPQSSPYFFLLKAPPAFTA